MFRQVLSRESAHKDSIWCCNWLSFKEKNYIITGSVDEKVKLWELEEEKTKTITEKKVFNKHELSITSITSAKNCNKFGTCSMDGFIQLYNFKDGIIKDEKDDNGDDDDDVGVILDNGIDCGSTEAYMISYHPDGNIIASGSHSGNINLWDATGEKKDKLLNKIEIKDVSFILSLEYSPDGSMFAIGVPDGNILIYDSETNQLMQKIQHHKSPVRTLSFDSDSKYLLSGSEDKQIKSYEVKSGELTGSYAAHQSWVLDVEFNPLNSNQFASSSSDKRVIIWDSKKQEPFHVFENNKDQVLNISYSPDGKRLTSVSDDATLQIYDVVESS